MRLLFAGLLLGLLHGLFAPLAAAQTLWRGVPAGAPPDAVTRAIPEARPPAQSPTLPTAEQGPQALLEIPAVDIAGGAFAVRFLFENERLQRIAMRADAGSPDAARALAQRVYSSLRQRYGLEISTKSRREAVSTGYDRRWLFRRTTVRLQVIDQRVVTLEYGVEAPRSGGGL